jgi:hypothetical protein
MTTYEFQPIIAGPAISPLDDTTVSGNIIRAVQAITPSTSGWNAGDMWMDISALSTTVAGTLRVWTGSAFNPTQTVTHTMQDMFTGSNGAAWSSNWATGMNPVSGTGYSSTIQGNQGQLTTSNTGGFSGNSRISRVYNGTNPTNTNTTFSFTFDATTPDILSTWARCTAANLDGGSGYSMSMSKSSNQWYLDKWASPFTGTTLGTAQTFNWVNGTQYSARFYVVGSTIQAKIWVAASPEPSGWTVSVTDTSFTSSGYTGISLVNGSAAAVGNALIDNYTIDPS